MCIRDRLKTLLADSRIDYLEGDATYQSRIDYVRERLRLLYVSITRAKKELVLTWNNGRSGKSTPAVAFQALIDHFNSRLPQAPTDPG